MPIGDGENADDGDIWFRVLTDDDNKYIKKGKIHPNAFKGKNVVAVPERQRPWDHELSGRLRSLVSNVIKEANDYCDEVTKKSGQKKTFGGVMFCRVVEARQTFERTISTNVCYTPLPTDGAHADFVFFGSNNLNEDTFDKLRLWLCELVTGLYPAQIEKNLLPNGAAAAEAYAQKS